MSLQQAVTYWKLRLFADAFKKIAIPDEPKPGISAPTKKALKLILAEATILFTSPNDDVWRSDPARQEHRYYEDSNQELSDKRALVLLDKWIKVEIRKLADEVVEVFKQRLGGSEEETDKGLLQTLASAPNPLEAISEYIVREMREEAALDLEIEKWSKIRDTEMAVCKAEIVELNQLLRGFKQDVTSGKYAALKGQYADFVKLEAELLQRKQKLTDMRQKIAENPSEVTNELEKSYKNLLEARHKVEGLVTDLQSKKAKYEALGPEFQQLLADWKRYGELIQQKEFVLNQMNSVGNVNGEPSFNLSLNSSFVLDSP